MDMRHLGPNLTVSAQGLGCMGMSEFYGSHNDTESLRVLHRAADLGVTFFDTADMYGPHHNETLLGQFLKERTERLTIATKFGIVRDGNSYARTLDNSPAYVRAACEASLRRLGIDKIDLYYVHRVDAAQPIELVMEDLAQLVEEGKIDHIGLCEVNAETLKRAHAVHPVTALQTEYSLWTRDVEREILPTCRALNIGFVAYSPLGRGYLTGHWGTQTVFETGDFRAALPRFQEENMRKNQPILDMIHKHAQALDCRPAQFALAWVMAQGEDIVPIPGTKRQTYLEENLKASALVLSQAILEDVETVLAQNPPHGDRYTAEGMKGVNR